MAPPQPRRRRVRVSNCIAIAFVLARKTHITVPAAGRNRNAVVARRPVTIHVGYAKPESDGRDTRNGISGTHCSDRPAGLAKTCTAASVSIQTRPATKSARGLSRPTSTHSNYRPAHGQPNPSTRAAGRNSLVLLPMDVERAGPAHHHVIPDGLFWLALRLCRGPQGP